MHRFLLRLGSQQFSKIKELADARGLSINSAILQLIESSNGANRQVIAGNQIDLDQIKDLYLDQLEAIVLYGSCARGEANEGSDIDLLMILKSHVSVERSLYRRWDEKNYFPSIISPAFAKFPEDVTSVQLGSLWRELALDGIVLWERDFKVSRFLGQLRRSTLNDSRAERKTAHGHGYWVLKGA